MKNPLFNASTLPFEAPDFEAVKMEHFKPAFEEGMKQELAEMEAIAQNPEPATFENTIVAMEKSGALLNRAASVFYNLASAHTNEEIQALQSEMAPKFAAHSDNILLNPQLFSRVQTLYSQRDELGLTLSTDERKLMEDTYRRFVRAGALLDDTQKDEMRAINERLSSLSTEFQRNLMTMTKERYVVVDTKEELAGLSEDQIKAAAEKATEKGHEGKFVLSITNTTRVPELAQLERREIRERLWKASSERGLGKNEGIDNRPLLLEMVELRAKRAHLLGYETYAHYGLETQTSKTPEAVFGMLGKLAKGVSVNSAKEAKLIEKQIKKEGFSHDLKPWDWEFFAEKVRQEQYAIDQDEVRPYFELNRVLKDGVFFTMNRLFGIEFRERTDLPVYHPDVRVFDVLDADGSSIGLFYADYFARPSKRGGAWMNDFVAQSQLLNKKPVIVNVMNIPKPVEGEPALISFDHVSTMFHEMGHGVHGLLSKVRYPSQSGTSVPRDFVEFPSTFQEDWSIDPEVLANYAYHYETGEAIPKDLLDKVIAANSFNMGFNTQEYLSAALLDMEWHSLTLENLPKDVETFEQNALAKYGLDVEAIPPRYKSAFFAHVFAGGYSAGYYAYIWSEVLAADAFAYMRENGGLTEENGKRFREMILSKGGSEDAMKLYRAFRKADPDPAHLLIRRGLEAETTP